VSQGFVTPVLQISLPVPTSASTRLPSACRQPAAALLCSLIPARCGRSSTVLQEASSLEQSTSANRALMGVGDNSFHCGLLSGCMDR
jgi:hypothetical protein